jgi:hypothetical protein
MSKRKKITDIPQIERHISLINKQYDASPEAVAIINDARREIAELALKHYNIVTGLKTIKYDPGTLTRFLQTLTLAANIFEDTLVLQTVYKEANDDPDVQLTEVDNNNNKK